MDREELREKVAEAMAAAWDGSYEIPEMADVAIRVVATAIANDLDALSQDIYQSGDVRVGSLADHLAIGIERIKSPLLFRLSYGGAPSLPANFTGKVADPTGCIQWVGAIQSRGYGSVSINGVITSAHKAAWEHVNGPVPDGLTIDHLCRNRACVNVEHMELVPGAENTRRQPRVALLGPGGYCSKGHPIATDADIYVNPRGSRECRECRRGHGRRSRAKR